MNSSSAIAEAIREVCPLDEGGDPQDRPVTWLEMERIARRVEVLVARQRAVESFELCRHDIQRRKCVECAEPDRLYICDRWGTEHDVVAVAHSLECGDRAKPAYDPLLVGSLMLGMVERIRRAQPVPAPSDAGDAAMSPEDIRAWKAHDQDAQRELLGQMVRAEWVRWAVEQPSPKPSWLLPWEQLAESDREVDRRIGQTIYLYAQEQGRREPSKISVKLLCAMGEARNALSTCSSTQARDAASATPEEPSAEELLRVAYKGGGEEASWYRGLYRHGYLAGLRAARNVARDAAEILLKAMVEAP